MHSGIFSIFDISFSACVSMNMPMVNE